MASWQESMAGLRGLGSSQLPAGRYRFRSLAFTSAPLMVFLETQPASIQPVQPGDEWASFCVTDPRQIESSLAALVREEAPLVLGFAGSVVTSAALWSSDGSVGRLRLRLTGTPCEIDKLAQLLRVRPARSGPDLELFAAAYRGDAKLQFDMPEPQLQRHDAEYMLHTAWPRQMLCLPRRSSVRVRRKLGASPVAVFPHPLAPDYRARLRVLNISRQGCALWLPRGEIPLAPGQALQKVEVQLDEESVFFSDVRVLHISLGGDAMPTLPFGEAEGLRVGCRWEQLPEHAASLLEVWIRGGRRRRDLVHLSFED
jgi:hypothetical protein